VRDIPILSDYDYLRMTEIIEGFDRIFVHSDPKVLPLDLGRPIPEVLSSRIEYTGYVTPSLGGSAQRSTYIHVHAGGGHDGQAFWAAVDSLRPAMSGTEFKLYGRNPAELNDLSSTMRWLGSARRSISMAGYNTVAEWLAFRTPTIFVPRRSESEQLKRLLRLQEFAGGPMAISDATSEGLRLAWDLLSENEPFRADVSIGGQDTFARSVARHLV
jgi:predicted glycosyltransferase